jgi:hypothetical protein
LINSVLFLEGGGTGLQLTQILVGSSEYFFVRAGGTADGFLHALYTDALGRDIDARALVLSEQALALAGPGIRGAIANVIFSSLEYRQNVAVGFFASFLDRAPTAPELAAVVNAQAGGMSDELLAAILLSQDEVFFRANR